MHIFIPLTCLFFFFRKTGKVLKVQFSFVYVALNHNSWERERERLRLFVIVIIIRGAIIIMMIIIFRAVGVELDHGGSGWSANMEPDSAASKAEKPAESVTEISGRLDTELWSINPRQVLDENCNSSLAHKTFQNMQCNYIISLRTLLYPGISCRCLSCIQSMHLFILITLSMICNLI